jgi:hypothetical protein
LGSQLGILLQIHFQNYIDFSRFLHCSSTLKFLSVSAAALSRSLIASAAAAVAGSTISVTLNRSSLSVTEFEEFNSFRAVLIRGGREEDCAGFLSFQVDVEPALNLRSTLGH